VKDGGRGGGGTKGSMEPLPFDRYLISLDKLLKILCKISVTVTQSLTIRFYNKKVTFTSFYCKIIGNYQTLEGGGALC